MEDLTGKQFGPYRIVAPLGEGGMAAVYRAYQPSVDRFVALKVLPGYFAKDPAFVGRFEQEAKVLARLQHVHILPVHDYGQAEGYTYIVMPFVETGTLADVLKGEPLPLPQIQKIISQVAGALDHAHGQGIIHRDIKPSNILMDQGGNCLLTDFGIAKMVEGTTAFTQTGGIIGTPSYMSPEQIRGEKLDGRSDIYSLGVILYEMATGRAPYRAETPAAIFVKHLHDPLPPPHLYYPDIPEGVERVILKALAKDRNDRFKTAGDLAAALAQGIAGELMRAPTALSAGMPAAEAELPPAPRRLEATEAAPLPLREKRPLPKWVWGLVGLLGLAVIAVAVISLLGGGAAEELAAPTSTITPVATCTYTPLPPTKPPPPTPVRVPAAAVGEFQADLPPDPWGYVIVPAGRPVLIAFVGDLSGQAAYLGQGQLQAVNLALQDAEEMVGRPVESIVVDGGCSPEGGAASATQILQNPNIVGVVGHACSMSCAAGIPLYEEAHLVSLSPSCTMPDLTGTGWQLFNRVALRDDWGGEGFSREVPSTGPYLDFAAAFQARYGVSPSDVGEEAEGTHIAAAFDATRILLQAIRQVGVVDDAGNLAIGRLALARAVRTTNRFPGVTGLITFDNAGDRLPPERAALGEFQGDLPPDPWGYVIFPAGQPILIAFVGDLSGPSAYLGEAHLQAVQLALPDAEAILGRPVEPIVVDGGCSPDGGRAGARQVIQNPNLVGVIGHTCSPSCAEGIPLYEEAHLVSLSPSCTASDLTAAGSPLFNRVALRDDWIPQAFFADIGSSQSYQDFAAAFKARYGISSGEVGGGGHGATVAYAYDATHILLQAIREVGVEDDAGNLAIGREALARAVRATDRYPGVTGLITFDDAGERLPPEGAQACPLWVAMVTDVGATEENGFVQNALQGLERAADELGVCIRRFQAGQAADYEPIMSREPGFDLVIGVGFQQGEMVPGPAELNADRHFAVLDYAYESPLPNVQSVVFAVDQPAFMAGYLAAAWADLKDPGDPRVAYVAGMEIPSVMQFVVGYESGVAYYNDQHGREVSVIGAFGNTFTEPAVGAELGNAMIDQGAEVIFGVGGTMGDGALAAARERGKWGIGVDVDQYVTLPEVGSILLTSVLKRLDDAAFTLVQDALRGEFRGGQTTVGTLENGGVGLAPFHDFEDQIPENIRVELEEIAGGFMAGRIATGW